MAFPIALLFQFMGGAVSGRPAIYFANRGAWRFRHPLLQLGFLEIQLPVLAEERYLPP